MAARALRTVRPSEASEMSDAGSPLLETATGCQAGNEDAPQIRLEASYSPQSGGLEHLVDCPPGRLSGQKSGPRHKRLPPLSPEERRRADERTCALLAVYGIDCYPATETALVAVDDGTVIHLTETRQRWALAVPGNRRAVATTIQFDLFKQLADLRHLRHFILRPAGHKAEPGQLASELARFSHDLDRHVGRLITAGFVKPLLTTIHIRLDTVLDMWDIHAHCVWRVDPDDLDAVWKVVGKQFSDAWREKDKIHSAGALVNYTVTRIVDHRVLQTWPDSAVVELWNLSKARLIRPAGEFAKFRRSLKGKKLIRSGDAIIVEDRVSRNRPSRREGPSQPLCGETVVGYTALGRGDQERLFAVVKRPRQRPSIDQVSRAVIEPANHSDPCARLVLAYGENQVNSPNEVQSLEVNPLRHVNPHYVQPPSQTSRRRHDPKLAGMRPRHRWMLSVWPKVDDRIPGPVRRRLDRLAAKELLRGPPTPSAWNPCQAVRELPGRSLGAPELHSRDNQDADENPHPGGLHCTAIALDGRQQSAPALASAAQPLPALPKRALAVAPDGQRERPTGHQDEASPSGSSASTSARTTIASKALGAGSRP